MAVSEGRGGKSSSTVAGVKGLSNEIAVTPTLNAVDLKTNIESALKRNAGTDASRISVETSSGKVTLRGCVGSWSERRQAEDAAWSAPGVNTVEDFITIN